MLGGRMHYFTGTEEQARQQLLAVLARDAATTPPNVATNNIAVSHVAGLYAARCEDRVRAGAMASETWKDYDEAIAAFVGFVKPHALVSHLTQDRFADYRRKLAAKYGPWALDRHIQSIRTMFRWAAGMRHIESVPHYADSFGKSKPRDKAMAKAKQREKSGDKVFTSSELAKLLNHPDCKGDLRAFVLMGMNAGCYSVDCSDLAWDELKRVPKFGWCVDRLRLKTKEEQRFVLWPEVVALIMAKRRRTGKVFETAYGNDWNQRNGIDSISMLFQRLRKAAGVTRAKMGFGAFRHTHISAVSQLPDLNAARLVRGHKFGGIEEHYDFPSWDRLKRITDHARRVLLLSIGRAGAARARHGGTSSPARTGRGPGRQRSRQSPTAE